LIDPLPVGLIRKFNYKRQVSSEVLYFMDTIDPNIRHIHGPFKTDIKLSLLQLSRKLEFLSVPTDPLPLIIHQQRFKPGCMWNPYWFPPGIIKIRLKEAIFGCSGFKSKEQPIIVEFLLLKKIGYIFPAAHQRKADYKQT